MQVPRAQSLPEMSIIIIVILINISIIFSEKDALNSIKCVFLEFAQEYTEISYMLHFLLKKLDQYVTN